DPDRLFSPVAELCVLSGPEATAWIEDPGTDVGNASALAAAALAHRQARGDGGARGGDDGGLAYVGQGRDGHVKVISRPAPGAGRAGDLRGGPAAGAGRVHGGGPATPAQAAGHGRTGGRLRRGPAAGGPDPGRGGRGPAGGRPPGPALPAPVPRQRPAGRPGR